MGRPLSNAAEGYQALYERLRGQILRGLLPAGARMPSSRELASQLGVARMTVVRAYRALVEEGYAQTRAGTGTFVAALAPDRLLAARRRAPAPPPAKFAPPAPVAAPGWLAPHMPALDLFPYALWARLAGRAARGLHGNQLAYQDAQGLPALREAIAAHWQATRGASIDPSLVLVTAGAQNAFDLCARALARPGELAAMESPGYMFARAAFRNAGLRVAEVPVDEHGIRVGDLERMAEAPRLLHLTPGHQQPTGALLSPARRLALLDFARRSGALLLEDDYDSEFRYAGRPLPVLQSLDTHGHVLLCSSFSKTLFPALRLGFLLATPATLPALLKQQAQTLRSASALDQRVLALFIAEGHYARHLRRMRRHYAQRRDQLRALLEGPAGKRVRAALDVHWPHTGFAAVGWLRRDADLQALLARAAERGLQLLPVPRGKGRGARPGVLLGFGSTPPAHMAQAVAALAGALAPWL